MGIYENYQVFLIVTMTLHFTIYQLRDIRKKAHKKDKQEEESSSNILIKFAEIVHLLVCYVISFFLFQLLLSTLGTYWMNLSTTPMAIKSQAIEISSTNLFNQLENEENPSRMLVAQKPFYLKVINETSIITEDDKEKDPLAPFHTLFSSDYKTAFVISSDTVVVWDISEPMDPKKITKFRNKIKTFFSAKLALNSQALFLDSGSVLQIINTTDLQNLNVIQDLSFRSEEELEQNPDVCFYPSLAESSDHRFLIVTNIQFRIYDVSDLNKPKMVLDDGSWMATTVRLSADDRYAYIGSQDSLKVYDFTNFEAPKLVSSLMINGTMFSCDLSYDQKTIYALTYVRVGEEFKINLYIINVEKPEAPVVQKELYVESMKKIGFTRLRISPDQTFLILRTITNMRVIGLRMFEMNNLLDTVADSATIAFLPGGEHALIFSWKVIRLAQISFNIPSYQSTSLQPNYINRLALNYPPQKAVLFGNRAFVLAKNPDDLNHKMLLDVDLGSDYSMLEMKQSFQLRSRPSTFFVSSDGKNIYYKSDKTTVQVLNTEGGNFSEVSSLQFDENFEEIFLVSSNKKTLYAVYKNPDDVINIYLMIYNISDSTPKLLSMLTLDFSFHQRNTDVERDYMILSQDEETLYLLDGVLRIIDVSDPIDPELLNTFGSSQFFVRNFAFSSDLKTCFLMVKPDPNQKFIMAVDLTDNQNPEDLGSIDIPVDSNDKLAVSADGKLLFLSTPEDFITIDVSNKSALTISEAQELKVSNFLLLPNAQNILIMNEGGLHIMYRKFRYGLFLPQHQFKLGETATNTLKIMELGKDTDNYVSIGQNYKFIDAMMYHYKINTFGQFDSSYEALPSSVTFSRENAVLTIDLTSRVSVNAYKIYFTASTQIKVDTFLQMDFTKDESQNLQAYLVGQGYLDTDTFLTEHFDENTPLVLNTQYSKYEQNIRKILKSHRFGLITTFNIESSLHLKEELPLQIETPSSNTITVRIHLLPNQKSKFVSQAFPSIKSQLDDEKLHLLLEGPMISINQALQSLLINIDDGGKCSGYIGINDGLNPELNRNFESLSNYIKTNGKPIIPDKSTVQRQVNEALIVAGENMFVEFGEKTFKDPHDRPLTYSLESINEKVEPPSWITLRDRRLMGIPPEEFFPYEISFYLKASNEYKSERVMFTLKVRLSFTIIFKRLLILVGYLFSAYKVWQHSDKLYNMIMRRSYRYPKTMKIQIDKEITEKDIFPILFIDKGSKKMANLILKTLLADAGIKVMQLIDSLVDFHQIDGSFNRQRLAVVIENIDLVKNSEYQNCDKGLVNELIFNDLVMKRLKLKSERKTSRIFEKIKSRWIHLVDMDAGSSQFFVKEKSLIHELKSRNLDADVSFTETLLSRNDEDRSSFSDSPSSKRSLSEGFQVNWGLLKDAIIAYAFSQHHMDIPKYEVFIRSREVLDAATMKRNCLKRCLKIDRVRLVNHSTKHLGYGLKHKFIENKVQFYGKIEEQIKRKTIAIQITTKRNWVLREFLVKGLLGGENNMVDSTTILNINEEL